MLIHALPETHQQKKQTNKKENQTNNPPTIHFSHASIHDEVLPVPRGGGASHPGIFLIPWSSRKVSESNLSRLC